MPLFVGKTTYQLDDVNRLRLPPKQRDAFGDEFYISIDRHGSLLIRTKEAMEDIDAKLKTLSMMDDCQDAAQKLYENTESAQLDSQGRFVLPQHIKDYAKIHKNVVVTGTPRGLAVWSEDVYNNPNNYKNEFDLFDVEIMPFLKGII